MNQFRKLQARLYRKLGIASRASLVFNTVLQGKRIRVPVFHNMGLPNLTPSDPWMIQLFSFGLNRRPGCLIDAGVNVGQTLVRFLSTDFSDRQYLGFEPNPDCVYYANRLIRENQVRNATVLPFGLSDVDGMVEMFANNSMDGAASIVPGFRDIEYAQTWRVLVRRGDDALKDLGVQQIALIKIDVEGAELNLIRGIKETIGRLRPSITCEVLPVYSLETDAGKFRLERQKELERHLSELDYRIVRIVNKTSQKCKLVPVDEFGVHDQMELADYVFLPAEEFDSWTHHFN